MSFPHLTTLGATMVLCATLFAGCSSDRGRSGTGSSAGTVSNLTGDDDSEVSAETQTLVARAILLDENDAPLEF